MATTPHLITADELLRRPQDGFRYGLVKGELRRTPPAGSEHGRIAVRFTWRLALHVETLGLGAVFAAETGFLLATDPDTVRAPDAAFVSRRRLDAAGDVKGFWPGAPDLAVEVISPGDTYTEVEEKATEWLQAGAPIVLALDPRKETVTVYRSLADITILGAAEVLDIGDIVSGFRLPIGEIFAR